MARAKHSAPEEKTVLVLQGGGALGAYQGGVYEALAEAGHRPGWIAGISIGAINAALIAGNPIEQRVERLREFWTLITSSVTPLPFFEEAIETTFNQSAAATTLLFGAPGFFTPRLVPPFAQPCGSAAALSYYDTSELRSTLERLVDFDRINTRGPDRVRVSFGAVDIATGNFAYFDSDKQLIAPEHIMASGALPPGLPPVHIGNTWYWDGGLVSNTPLQYVIDADGPDDLLAFQVDLFSARGPMPKNLMEAAEREKDIRYSSRTRLNTDVLRQRQMIGAAATRLAQKLPAELRKDPDLKFLTDKACTPALTLVHLIYKSKHAGTFSKDYEFSRASIEGHWTAGREDVRTTLSHPRWRERGVPERGTVRVFDLTGPVDSMVAAVMNKR